MKLYLENIGKISHADIEIKGITVIAGENNTGKSTVGKVLFSVFESFHTSNKGLRDIRVRLLAQDLQVKFSEEFDGWYEIQYKQFARKLIAMNKTGEVDLRYLSKEINNNITYPFSKINGDEIDTSIKISDKFVKEIKDLLDRYCYISDEKIYSSILQASFKSEFDSQICNLFNQKNEKSSIRLINTKDKYISIVLRNNIVEYISKTIASLVNEALYIDDPAVLDNSMIHFLFGSDFNRRIVQSHKRMLMRKLLKENHQNIESAFNDVLVNERLEKIIEKINQICEGSLFYNESNGFSYYENNLNIKLHSNNLSAGLKTFAIIKTLLLNGSIKENDIIILDEPEVHLHPEWQILLAEIIVLLHDEFKIHVLLTTHSPYFLEAIEVYAQKYHVDDKCRYYLAENVGRSSEIIDVTDNTEKIYKKLARPFQDLENARYDSND